MFETVTELCDVISHLIYCTQDETVLLTISSKNSNEYYLPSIRNPSWISWTESSNRNLSDIFDCDYIEINCLLRHSRVWVPDNDPLFLNHVVFGIECDNVKKFRTNNAKGKYRGKLKWFSEAEIMHFNNYRTLASPEIVDLTFEMIKRLKIKNANIFKRLCDFTMMGCLAEITSELITIPQHSFNPYDQLINEANFKRGTTNLIYREFLLHSFPYLYMSFATFKNFVEQLGWEQENSYNLFRTADTCSRNALSYKDFLYILTAIDPTVKHEGIAAELRCQYIFRFFDENDDSNLNYVEFRKFVYTVKTARNKSGKAVALARNIDKCLKSLNVNQQNCNISMAKFLALSGNVQLSDVSNIFRSKISIQTFIYDLQVRERMNKDASEINYKNELIRKLSSIFEMSVRDIDDYSLAIHTLCLQKNPLKINADEIFTFDSSVVSDIKFLQTKLNPVQRAISLNAFNQKSLTNQLLKFLRNLQQINYSKLPSSEIISPFDFETFGKNLIELCEKVRLIFRDEPRLLLLQSPVYIFGDLHGNFADLLFFEKILWNLGLNLCSANLLLLGDYVDRGMCGVEVVTYLFAYKVQCPTKIHLLRGNHENRAIQRVYTFEEECCQKFGQVLGMDVWNAINATFDAMPLAASIDSKIFCCHGGIPPPWLCPVVATINTIPTTLPDPLVQSPLAWELMWNDPLEMEQLTEPLLEELIANEGFVENRRRGTGHKFSVQALERFLQINGFSHIVRAHQHAHRGFKIQLNGRAITVFSSSRYCGSNNEAGCVIVDQRKLRLLRLGIT